MFAPTDYHTTHPKSTDSPRIADPFSDTRSSDPKHLLIERIRRNVPSELLGQDQLVCWRKETRNDKQTKVPYNAKTGSRAESDNPGTWASFDQAAAACLAGGYSGVGFMFSEDDPYCGVDFDHCVQNGVIDPEKLAQILALGSYAEYSQSGTGVHVIGRGVLPEGGRKSTQHQVEMYDHKRFFVVTGDHIGGTPTTVRNFQKQLVALHRDIFPPKQEQPTHRQQQTQPVNLDDQQLIERACAARNGAAFDRLWRGDASDHNDDHSAADMALCVRLAWWTNRDGERVDRLFRMSGLMRQKWDARHYSSGETYGQATIAKALDQVHDGYTGSGGSGDAGNERTPKNDRQPDLLGRKWEAWRKHLQRADLAALVPAALQSATGYRTMAREKRCMSAVLDILQGYRSESGPISQAQLIVKAGLSSSAVQAAIKVLLSIGFIEMIAAPESDEGGAQWFKLGDSCVDSVPEGEPACVTNYCAIYATIFTGEKARDAWQRNPLRPYKAATVKALGANALIVADCLFDYGQQTPSLIGSRTHLSAYSVSRTLAIFREHNLLDIEKQGRNKLVSLKPDWLDKVRALEPCMTSYGQLLKKELNQAERRSENYAARLERGIGDVDDNLKRLDKADALAIDIYERQIYQLYSPDEAARRMRFLLAEKQRRRNAALERIGFRLDVREKLKAMGASPAIAQHPELVGDVAAMLDAGQQLIVGVERTEILRNLSTYRAEARVQI